MRSELVTVETSLLQTVVENETQGILREALMRLEGGKKWSQYSGWVSNNGRMCAVGALLGRTGSYTRGDVDAAAHQFLITACGIDHKCVEAWNDDVARTFADVESAYLRAIELAGTSPHQP